MAAKIDLIRDIKQAYLVISRGCCPIGDRIHATICKHGLDLFRERIKEHAMYNMPNFIVRITAHKYKLSFYTKTDVEVLPIETFLLTHSKCAHLLNLRQMLQWMKICCLVHYIGKVVGKEEAMGMITRTSEESKRIALQLEDLEHMLNIKCLKILLDLYYAFHSKKHEIKYTLFGESVDQVLPHFEQDDGEPFIMFVQLFKSNVYLSSVNVQSTYYVFKCYFNPNLSEVIDLKKRRVGFKATLRYKLQVIVTNESGCMKLLLWNKEAEHMVGKTAEIIKELCKWKKGESYPKYMDNIVDKRFLFKLNITYKNINVVEGVYSVLKISDDEYLMSCFGYANSSFDASCSQHVPNTSTTEIGDNSNGHGPVSLSKDLAVEGNGDSSSETPAKRSSPDTGDGSTAEALTRILRGIVEKNLD
ncbi:hypothetical protein AHAS_Ahas01G0312800 [Arachis hypogaea]